MTSTRTEKINWNKDNARAEDITQFGKNIGAYVFDIPQTSNSDGVSIS